MAQELNRMVDIIEGVQADVAKREVDIKEYKAQVDAYDAETKRISAMQAGMTEEQIQDIVMGTIAGALDTGDLISGSPEMREAPMMDEEMPQQQPMPEMGDMEGMGEMPPPPMPPEGMME